MLVDLIVCWQSIMHYLTSYMYSAYRFTLLLSTVQSKLLLAYTYTGIAFSLALFLLSCIEEALVWIVTNTSSLPNFDKNKHQSLINVLDYYTVLSCNNKVINFSCIGNLAPVKFCLLRNAFCTFFFWFTVDNNASVEVKTRTRILCFKKQREV